MIVLKHHNYKVDPKDSVLKAPETNDPTMISQTVSAKLINNRYSHIWYKTSTYTTTEHVTRSIEHVAMSEHYTNTIYK